MDYDSYSYYDYSSSASSGALAVGVGVLIFSFVFGIAIYVLMSIFMGKLFRKAGVPFWKAWVPIYNSIKFFQIGGQNPLYILFALIPFAGGIVLLVFMCIAAYNIGKKLGKSDAWVVLYIFLSPVWTGICGLDKSVWNESLGKASLAPETAMLASGAPQYAQPITPNQQPPVMPTQPPTMPM